MRQSRIEIAMLIVLTACCVWALYARTRLVWGDPPLSPLSPIYPDTALPQMYVPLFAGPQHQATPFLPALKTATQNRLESLWASPWIWFAFGIIVFGGIAYGELKLAGRTPRTNDNES